MELLISRIEVLTSEIGNLDGNGSDVQRIAARNGGSNSANRKRASVDAAASNGN
jgi:hypothetical protein